MHDTFFFSKTLTSKCKKDERLIAEKFVVQNGKHLMLETNALRCTLSQKLSNTKNCVLMQRYWRHDASQAELHVNAMKAYKCKRNVNTEIPKCKSKCKE